MVSLRLIHCIVCTVIKIKGPSSWPRRRNFQIQKSKTIEEAEDTNRIIFKVYLAENQVEESREPYLSKPGPEEWQEPPAPPSTSSSSSVEHSPSPGSFKGMKRGKIRSAAAPVVMGTIGPYHAQLLPDCRTVDFTETGRKTTQQEVELSAGQSGRTIQINSVENDVIGS